uniref:Uncharacterized protein n=1 Tax=Rhipicephalus zambeziensis TaxID=60191 RepID=A0A224Y7C8_9ACAR
MPCCIFFSLSPHGKATVLPPEVNFLAHDAVSLSCDPELFEAISGLVEDVHTCLTGRLRLYRIFRSSLVRRFLGRCLGYWVHLALRYGRLYFGCRCRLWGSVYNGCSGALSLPWPVTSW